MTTPQLALFEKPQPVTKPRPARPKIRRSAKYFHEDNRHLPLHCADCGCDLIIGWGHKHRLYCRKHYEIRKGLRDSKTGRLLAS